MKKINIFLGIIAICFVILGGGYTYYKHITKDVEPPVFKADTEEIECSIDASQEELCAGLTAYDNKDGDLTDHIIVSEIKIKENDEIVKNKFDISYLVFDSSSNMSSVTRTLTYTDYHSPRFSIQEKLRFNSISTVDLNKIIKAEDCIDGDISNQVSVEMGDTYLNAISYGTYDCVISVTNSFGDTSSIPLTFEIYDSTSAEEIAKPDIRLSQYVAYVKAGEKFSPKSYLSSMAMDGTPYYLVKDAELNEPTTYELDYGYRNKNYDRFILKSTITINDSVDTNTPGMYSVEYSYTHPEKGITGTAKLIVIVEE